MVERFFHSPQPSGYQTAEKFFEQGFVPCRWKTSCVWHSVSPGRRKAAGEEVSISQNGPITSPVSVGPSL